MKHLPLFLGSICLLIFLGAGCAGISPKGSLNDRPLEGSWIGIGNAIGYGQDYRIDRIQLNITPDGVFSFDDMDQDTTDLMGVIDVDSGDSFSLSSTEDMSEVSLPLGWDDMQEEDVLSYRLFSDSQLVLSYNDIDYFFIKKPAAGEEFPENASLYDLGENDIWYSRPDQKASGHSYCLKLFRQYAELYDVTPGHNSILATSLYLLDKDGDSYTFCSRRTGNKNIPPVLESLTDDLSDITLTLVCEDESLTMSCGDQSLVFYSKTE